MKRRMGEIQTWAWLVGGVCFAGAWLSGAMAPDMVQAWNLPVVVGLILTSICWGVAGWYRAQELDMTYEMRAFNAAILAVVPWLLFIMLLIMPYALGVQ
jgi:hypothetical protein